MLHLAILINKYPTEAKGSAENKGKCMKKFLAVLMAVMLGMSAFAQGLPGAAGAAATTTAMAYDAGDIVESLVFDRIISIDLSSATLGDTDVASGETIVDGVTVAKTAYGIAITSKSNAAITYKLEGSLAGTLSVASDSPYQLYLDGVTINADNGPAINLQSKKKAYIVLAANSINTLSDTISRVKELDEKAALSGKGAIVISGEGTLNVTGNYKHAIYAKEYVRIRGGSLNVTVTTRDGIRTDQGFILDGGKLNIVGTGSGIDDESKGIKVDGTESAPGKGQIVINDGGITIRTVGKAITAGWDIDEDATTASTADDPNPDVYINGGTIDITTTGTPYEKTDAEGKAVSCSPEGIEAKSDLVISGGTIRVRTADDCLNAGTSIVIKGGDLDVISSANDAIDSNGTLNIAGGTIMAIGTGGPEGPFDCDTNSFAITGGTLVGIGGMTSGPTAEACTQNVLIAGGYAKGSAFIIKNKAGATVFSWTIPASCQTLVFSSPALKAGEEYSIVASTGTVSTGTVVSFTPSSPVTQIGGQIFGMGFGTGGPGMGGPGSPNGSGMMPPPEGMARPTGLMPPEGMNPPPSK